MEKGIDNEVFESLLKAAVLQNSLNEIAKYPSQEEIDKIDISNDCDRKLRRMIKKQIYRSRLIKGGRIVRKAAMVFAIFMGISFVVLLQFKEVRAACYDIFIKITEKYIQFDYSSYKDKEIFKVNYLPEGYHEIERIDLENECTWKYSNGMKDEILIYYSTDSSTDFDNEHYNITDIKVGGADGKYFASIDYSFDSLNILTWHSNNGYFFIMSSLDKDEMIKIAENIK